MRLNHSVRSLKRVVVTGIGAVSPLGINCRDNWNRLIAAESGIVRIKELPQIGSDERFPDVCMGLVHRDFDHEKWKVSFTNNNLNKYALAASDEAINDACLQFASDDQLRLRTGVNIGVMNSNMTRLTEIIQEAAGAKGFDRLNRMTILHVLTNMPTANVSIKYNLKGPSACASVACATGAAAIGDSLRVLQLGNADVMIAGGSEDALTPTSIHASIKMQAMCTKKFSEARETSRPFDKKRAGFVLSEGSGVLVLETLEHALKRKAPQIYCEVLGYGCSSDGYHLTRPLESGDGAYRAMNAAIQDAGISICDIDHINCHATSTATGDTAEAVAINHLLSSQEQQDQLQRVTITASKSSIGHTFGAAGALESIYCILAIKNNICPPLLNLNDDSDMPHLNFARESHQQQINYALKNSFGFGGTNSSLVFGRFSD